MRRSVVSGGRYDQDMEDFCGEAVRCIEIAGMLFRRTRSWIAGRHRERIESSENQLVTRCLLVYEQRLSPKICREYAGTTSKNENFAEDVVG